MKEWISWNENIRHPYQQLIIPENEEELAQAVSQGSKVRIIGTGRSSADIVAGTETLISLEKYNKVRSFDQEKGIITVETGILLSELIPQLEEAGWCIPCLPDIDVITLGGALATGTHGTGREGRLLSDYLMGCRVIRPNGEREDVLPGDLLEALKVSLGLLGVLSQVTLKLEPLYYLAVEEKPVKDEIWLEKWPQWHREHDFLRILFLPHVGYSYVIRGNRVDPQARVKERSGPWYYKFRREFSRILYNRALKKPSFTVLANKLIAFFFFRRKQVKKGTLYGATVTKSRGSTLELAEWTIGFSGFNQAFTEVRNALNDPENEAFAHIPMDVRFIRKDSGWLSYAYGEDTVTIGCVTRQASHADTYRAFDVVEEIFLRHGARPHWAKRFKAGSQDMEGLYPRWKDFLKLRKERDPQGKFLNKWLSDLFQ